MGSATALVASLEHALSHPEARTPLRERARQRIVDAYDLHRVCLPQQLALLGRELGLN